MLDNANKPVLATALQFEQQQILTFTQPVRLPK